MHIPDGFLTNRMALSLDAFSGASILFAARRLKLELSARMIPIMGVLSAFIFAAQILNFPVFGGTSGHLLGGALLGILLGPMAGLLTNTTRFVELLRGMRKLGCPKVVVANLSFLYRYLFVLADEVQRLRQARDSRRVAGPARSRSCVLSDPCWGP